MIKIFLSQYKLSLLMTVFLTMVMIFGFPDISSACQINSWSVGFSHAIFTENSRDKFNIIHPPNSHQRAHLWLARQALAWGDPLEAQLLVESLVKEGNKDALLILGDALVDRGDFPGAVKIWQQAGGYNTLIQAAWQAREQGLPEEALLAGQAAWVLDPKIGTLPLSTFMSDAGELKAAKSLLTHMVAEYPSAAQRPGWLLRLGDFSRNQESWDSAIYFYRQTLNEQFNNIYAHVGLGWAYYERGDDLKEALQEFNLAIELSPDHGDGYFAIGQVMAREQRYAEMDAWFVKALERNPQNRLWMMERANNLRDAGILSKAMILYNEMVEHFPDWAYVYYEFAWASKVGNHSDEAIQLIEQAMVLQYPENFWYFWRAGVIYEWADRPEEALDVYQKALSLSPENQAAKQAVERLANFEPQ